MGNTYTPNYHETEQAAYATGQLAFEYVDSLSRPEAFEGERFLRAGNLLLGAAAFSNSIPGVLSNDMPPRVAGEALERTGMQDTQVERVVAFFKDHDVSSRIYALHHIRPEHNVPGFRYRPAHTSRELDIKAFINGVHIPYSSTRPNDKMHRNVGTSSRPKYASHTKHNR